MQCACCNQYIKNLYATCQSCFQNFCNEQGTPVSLSHILKHIKETKHNVFSVPQLGLLQCNSCQRSNIIDLYQDPSGICFCTEHKNNNCFRIVQNKIINLRYTIFSQQNVQFLNKQETNNSPLTNTCEKSNPYNNIYTTKPSLPTNNEHNELTIEDNFHTYNNTNSTKPSLPAQIHQKITYKEIKFENLTLPQTIQFWITKIQSTGNDFSDVKIIDADDLSALKTRKFYTDGGLTYTGRNYGQGGYAAIEVVNQQIISQFFSGFNFTSSIRMEMMAILLVLESTVQNEQICIGTDSLSTIQEIVQNIIFYRENGKIRTSNKNSSFDLVCRILAQMKGRKVAFCFVRAHGTNKFNNYVDELTHKKRFGSDDLLYKVQIEFQNVKKLEFQNVKIGDLLQENDVYHQDYFTQSKVWIGKLNQCKRENFSVKRVEFEDFEGLKMQKFTVYNYGIGNSVCVVCDGKAFLPVQFSETTAIRVQLYGLLFVLILQQDAKQIAILCFDQFIKQVLVDYRQIWVNSRQDEIENSDLLAQIYFYSLGKEIIISVVNGQLAKFKAIQNGCNSALYATNQGDFYCDLAYESFAVQFIVNRSFQ